MPADLAFPKKKPRGRIDKSALAIPVFLPWRSSIHLGHVGAHCCCVPGCGRPAEVHHPLDSPELKARGRKCSDYFCIPLCAEHHRGGDSPHGWGNETAWFESKQMVASVIWISLQRSSPVAGEIERHLSITTTQHEGTLA